MEIVVTVTTTVDRVTGKFASRDAIVEAITDAINDADPGTIDTDDGQYETTDWTVDEAPPARAARAQRITVTMGGYRFVIGESRLAVFHAKTKTWVDSPKFMRPMPRCVHDLREAAYEWLGQGRPTDATAPDGSTYCLQHDRFEASSNDGDHTPAVTRP